MKFSVMTLPLLPMPAIPGLEPPAEPQTCSLTELYGQIRAAGAEALDMLKKCAEKENGHA